MSSHSQHVRSLDGIRGLAVLAVMSSHLFPGNAAGIFLPIVALTHYGASGVDLFFVLSGFLITGILFDSLHDPRYFRNFYARRTLRIFPLYYAVVLFCFTLAPWTGPHSPNKWALLLYLQNTPIAGPDHPINLGHSVNLGHFWSLAVEEQFYLVWPLLIYLIRDRKRLLWVCLGLSSFSIALRIYLAATHATAFSINGNTLCRMDSLLVGAAIALLLRGKAHDAFLRNALQLMVGAAAAVIVFDLVLQSSSAGAIPGFGYVYRSLRYTLFAIGAAGLIGCCLRQGSHISSFFEGRFFCFMGRYSYGLYIFHLIFLAPLLRFLKGTIGLLTPNKVVQVAGAGIVAFGLSVLVAYLSYNLYEKRFLRMKRFFDYSEPVLVVEHETLAHTGEERGAPSGITIQ